MAKTAEKETTPKKTAANKKEKSLVIVESPGQNLKQYVRFWATAFR